MYLISCAQGTLLSLQYNINHAQSILFSMYCPGEHVIMLLFVTHSQMGQTIVAVSVTD